MRMLWLLCIFLSGGLVACGNSCGGADCAQRLDGTLPEGMQWPDGFCDEASGTLTIGDFEWTIEAGLPGEDSILFGGPGAACEAGMLAVAHSPEIGPARLVLTNGEFRMTLSTVGSELVERLRPNGPDCPPVCGIRIATIEIADLR
jgi:hypothetical protein